MKSILLLASLLLLSPVVLGQNVLVFQSDFGTADGAVAAMKGVSPVCPWSAPTPSPAIA